MKLPTQIALVSRIEARKQRNPGTLERNDSPDTWMHCVKGVADVETKKKKNRKPFLGFCVKAWVFANPDIGISMFC